MITQCIAEGWTGAGKKLHTSHKLHWDVARGTRRVYVFGLRTSKWESFLCGGSSAWLVVQDASKTLQPLRSLEETAQFPSKWQLAKRDLIGCMFLKKLCHLWSGARSVQRLVFKFCVFFTQDRNQKGEHSSVVGKVARTMLKNVSPVIGSTPKNHPVWHSFEVPSVTVLFGIITVFWSLI